MPEVVMEAARSGTKKVDLGVTLQMKGFPSSFVVTRR
jgi:hypothetical protein